MCVCLHVPLCIVVSLQSFHLSLVICISFFANPLRGFHANHPLSVCAPCVSISLCRSLHLWKTQICGVMERNFSCMNNARALQQPPKVKTLKSQVKKKKRRRENTVRQNCVCKTDKTDLHLHICHLLDTFYPKPLPQPPGRLCACSVLCRMS